MNYLKEVRLGSAVIKTFLGFLDGGDLVYMFHESSFPYIPE